MAVSISVALWITGYALGWYWEIGLLRAYALMSIGGVSLAAFMVRRETK